MKDFAFSAALGIVIGIVLVWWIRPDTSAGTVFIMVATTIFCVISGVVLRFVGGLLRKS